MFDTILERPRILSSETRLAVWNHVAQLRAHPTDVARSMNMAASTISCHLRALERAGLVRHVQLGRYREYYLTGVRWGILSDEEIDAGTMVEPI